METQNNNKSLLKDYVEVYGLTGEAIAHCLNIDVTLVESWLDLTETMAGPSDEQLLNILKVVKSTSTPLGNHLFSSSLDSSVDELEKMKGDLDDAGLGSWATRLGGIINVIVGK